MPTQVFISQKCSEWAALVDMTKMLISCPRDLIYLISSPEATALGSALGHIENALPDGLICETAAAVLLTQAERDVLAKVVDWFCDLMILHRDMIDNQAQFEAKMKQARLIKLNLCEDAKAHAA